MQVAFPEKIISEARCDLCFAYAGGADTKNRTLRTIRMSEVQFATLENRAYTRKNMILSLDVGFKIRLQMAEPGEKI
jgi:hypothetical protein